MIHGVFYCHSYKSKCCVKNSKSGPCSAVISTHELGCQSTTHYVCAPLFRMLYGIIYDFHIVQTFVFTILASWMCILASPRLLDFTQPFFCWNWVADLQQNIYSFWWWLLIWPLVSPVELLCSLNSEAKSTWRYRFEMLSIINEAVHSLFSWSSKPANGIIVDTK